MVYKNNLSNNDIKKEIKAISTKENIPISEICKKIDILPQSYQNLYKKQKLAFSDIANILDILGYDLEINFIKRQ